MDGFALTARHAGTRDRTSLLRREPRAGQAHSARPAAAAGARRAIEAGRTHRRLPGAAARLAVPAAAGRRCGPAGWLIPDRLAGDFLRPVRSRVTAGTSALLLLTDDTGQGVTPADAGRPPQALPNG
jgi:hypothetical protein